MTVCDRCKQPRSVSFAVCPYRFTFQHEHVPEKGPRIQASYELCDACAKRVGETLMVSTEAVINQGSPGR